MADIVTDEKLDKYFSVTKEALAMVREKGLSEEFREKAEDALDMAQRYYDDAKHFLEKGDKVTAFAALNYAHGWLDAGARFGLFKVNDSRLFTVDDE
ncbi:MAG: DUF357 domain-containing protein [Candidatus Woesearchaeota archaeon]